MPWVWDRHQTRNRQANETSCAALRRKLLNEALRVGVVRIGVVHNQRGTMKVGIARALNLESHRETLTRISRIAARDSPFRWRGRP